MDLDQPLGALQDDLAGTLPLEHLAEPDELQRVRRPCSVIGRIRRPASGKPFHWGMISGRLVRLRFFHRHSYSAQPRA
jgi:hypothetical protein